MKYLVMGTEGPSFLKREEMAGLLEEAVLPTFDALSRLENEKKILGGGLPVGDRALVFIIEAASNEELDRLLRDLPLWGALKWKVTPLAPFSARGGQERETVKKLKGGR